MPTSTFFNLPEEKRERVVEAAIDEFAAYFFYKASVNRIVEKADIPKGSFYQYFENKKDLFKYIIDLMGDKKLTYIQQVTADLETVGFFELLRQLYRAGIKFAREYPKLQAIGARVLRMNDSSLKQEIMGDSAEKSNQFFEQMLAEGIEHGEIDAEVDIELTAFMLTKLSQILVDYFFNQLEAEGLEELVEVNEEEMMEGVRKMLYVIENGIKN